MIVHTPRTSLPSDVRATILAHYARVAPLLAQTLGPIPVVGAVFPHGVGSRERLFHRDVPANAPSTVTTVTVHTASGDHRYLALEATSLQWAVDVEGCVEFHSWSARAADPTQLRYARILFAPHGTATQTMVKEALLAARVQLQNDGYVAVPCLDGVVGAALWIPFADAPDYAAFRDYAQDFCATLARRHPTLITDQHLLAHRGNLVHVSGSSNAVGHFSALPYSLRGGDERLNMMTPLHWSELGTIDNGTIDATTFPARLTAAGDVFAEQTQAIGAQHFRRPHAALAAQPHVMLASQPLVMPAAQPQTMPAVQPHTDVHGHIIVAAVTILADGKPRTADELLAEAIARDLVPKTTTRKYVYSALIEYIARTRGNERRPLITQDVDRRFRANHPADDWAEPKTPLAPPPAVANCAALTDRLRSAATGTDPDAFERAVCDAFTALGFIATHIGGYDAPDGHVDAPLGPLAYRVMLECKTSSTGIVAEPDAAEAAKYRDAYHAQHAILIGPGYGQELELASELRTHNVAAWTVDDLAALLAAPLDLHAMQQLFAPGFATDVLSDLMWDRDHGARKRVAVIAEILHEEAWRAQTMTAADADRAPLLTEDVALLLVDQHLHAAGTLVPCTREEVRAAIAYLTSPLTGIAVAQPGNAFTIVRLQ